MRTLAETALALVDSGRGILAADESIGTMSQRLTAEGIAPTEENRRRYRELLLTPRGLSRMVSGIILCDETLRQQVATVDGNVAFPLAAKQCGILPGIKVDAGTTSLAFGHGALVTEGLDGLRDRLAEYADLGAAFAKWRAVIDVETATEHSIEVNAHALARYAALCQEQGIVPIVEPEVLCAGAHDIGRCEEVTDRTLAAVFAQLRLQKVEPEAMVLKPNLVTPGTTGPSVTPSHVADATLRVLERHVPSTVPGIAFLSGGHDNATACQYLAALNGIAVGAPWRLTYSFGRALVSDALHAWGGEDANLSDAQATLLSNCARAAAALEGAEPAPASA
ncbi:class I fructose-bisphosphate aldolase [Nocardioides pelophilus]|uniref:class I fructose-bisphosphate aldolase n=1 Tax=Nocardioides pelophilus TaxID=2172019 RepID=UPI001600410F|nr:class I fructose-bisphosphate aldolase [Nocardioides pelophilus]